MNIENIGEKLDYSQNKKFICLLSFEELQCLVP
ncbi:MAG: hypothetical protein HeimC3_25720 [Candidatus Heimdallarchaeota archaeon LC_3]|nr:MAG: hypothetical protein HeimC3_25720 [Candidatus Heimdallarchaeota archaeon LC_3]